MSEPHEVVKLLLARMESHPEEFRRHEDVGDRWGAPLYDIQTFGNAADKAALDEKLRDIRLGEIHERVMDEMLNGEDRRRKAEEDRAYERHLATSLQHTKQKKGMNTIMRIDSNGYVGVGNATPSTQLGGVASINRGE